ncbi:hypothetical protein, partial [Staphylococcus epidermidis]|uniref:hypothetical protein n=1 Tax=Staphylococcus epidermidis TaxID=1282 RepID=UPI00164335C7
PLINHNQQPTKQQKHIPLNQLHTTLTQPNLSSQQPLTNQPLNTPKQIPNSQINKISLIPIKNPQPIPEIQQLPHKKLNKFK